MVFLNQEQSGETRFADFLYFDGGDQTMRDVALANMAKARTLGLPQLEMVSPHDRKAIVVAGAPSVLAHKEQILEAKRNGAFVVGVNSAHDWLIEIGCVPDAFIVFEVSVFEPLAELKKHKDVTYYIASHCHPGNFDWAKGYKRIVWHSVNDWDGGEQAVAAFGCGAFMVGGGTTTMMRSLNVLLVLGYRDIELFGVDSSFENESHGVGPLRTDPTISAIASGKDGFRSFKTLPYLARQADEFARWCRAFGHMAETRVHGDGLLPYIHRSLYPHKYED
jgi:hypothetical protein